MAPPTPILIPEQISREKERIQTLKNKKKCELKSLTQHLCHAEAPGEYVCVPFKRVFEKCLGHTLEVTDLDTNSAGRF